MLSCVNPSVLLDPAGPGLLVWTVWTSQQLTVCQGGFTLSTGTVVLVLRLNEHGGTGFASTRRHLAVASRAGPAGHDRQRRLN